MIPASERGHVEVVRYLLEETDVDVDHVNNLGWTALLEAVILGDGGPTTRRSSGCCWTPARTRSSRTGTASRRSPTPEPAARTPWSQILLEGGATR